MQKIKVLHITQATIGGTLEYIKLFFSHIDREKYEIYLVCPSYGPMKEEIEKLGVTVYPIEMTHDISIKDDLKSFWNLKKLIAKVKPDLVHLHSSKAGVLGKLASYVNKVPVIYNAHGWSFSMDVSNFKKYIYILIERFTSKFCDVIVNISNYEYMLAKQYKIAPDNKMITIHNGIDTNKFDSYNIHLKEDILKELGIPNNALIIGMIARISEQKDPVKFVNIAQRICESIDNAYFVLVGDGEQRDKIENIISEYKLNDRIKITGWVNDVNKYLSIFDIAILTSRWEGFGLVIAEYMAASKPVVASNIGGIPELIVDKYNGDLINLDDIDGFVQSILKLSKDEELKNRYIYNSKKILKEKFDINKLVSNHEELYIDILNNTAKK